MKTDQYLFTEQEGWEIIKEQDASSKAQLMLVFGNKALLQKDDEWLRYLRSKSPDAQIVASSTAGEIMDVEVHDNSISATAIYFEKTPLSIAKVSMEGNTTRQAAERLANEFNTDGLSHLLVFSGGLQVNGTKLIQGLTHVLPQEVSITGGLAGDGSAFESTCVGLNALPSTGQLIGVALYGEDIKIGYGSVGGWDPFGPDRRVTKSESNVLYELDGKPALELYKSYLGDKASSLPSSALLFPLSMKEDVNDNNDVVRTILSVNEEQQSMTFAGDVPEGYVVRLMKANFDRLVDGAYNAAANSKEIIGTFEPELALLISCVGRKLVLGQRIEDEVESVREIVGDNAALTGFYSYGEIAPNSKDAPCRLHNQTMTITLMAE